MAVSLDMIQALLQRVMVKLDEMTTVVDVDRRNSRSMYDNLNIELGRKIGGLDAKIEIGLTDLQEQVNRVEGKIDQLGEQVAYLVRMQQDKG